jgi:hypothetical protein
MSTTMDYTFTRDQLFRLLGGTIEMFVEYRDVHGKPEQDGADIAAVSEMLEGLDAERELAEAGECKPTMQVYAAAVGEPPTPEEYAAAVAELT